MVDADGLGIKNSQDVSWHTRDDDHDGMARTLAIAEDNLEGGYDKHFWSLGDLILTS